MKGKGRIVLLIVCFALMVLVWTTPAHLATKSPVKIGVNLELTGPWAEVTKILRMAMVMEVERINAAGGIQGQSLELLIEDNGFDASRAAANMTKFARNKEIPAVIGPFEDNFQATTRAIAEREQITNIIICPSNPMVRALKQKWSFNIAHNDIIVSQKLVDLCLARGYKKILVFPAQIPLAQSLAEYFTRFAEEKGMKVILSQETHKPTDIDMTPQLLKLKPIIEREKVDAFYACTTGPTGAVLCKNIRNLGIKIPVIAPHSFGFGFVPALGGEAMEGVEFGAGKTVVPDQLVETDPVRPIVMDFDRRMRARYSMGADQISGHGYDTVWLLCEALKRCEGNITRTRLRNALEATRDYKGCMGIYNYGPTDHDGLTKKDLVFIRIEGGRFKRLTLPGFE